MGKVKKININDNARSKDLFIRIFPLSNAKKTIRNSLPQNHVNSWQNFRQQHRG